MFFLPFCMPFRKVWVTLAVGHLWLPWFSRGSLLLCFLTLSVPLQSFLSAMNTKTQANNHRHTENTEKYPTSQGLKRVINQVDPIGWRCTHMIQPIYLYFLFYKNFFIIEVNFSIFCSRWSTRQNHSASCNAPLEFKYNILWQMIM